MYATDGHSGCIDGVSRANYANWSCCGAVHWHCIAAVMQFVCKYGAA